MMRLLFWKALIGLLTFDLLLCGRNFARMHRLVRSWKVAARPEPPDVVERVSKAVNYACVAYPKRVLCLQRSAVTTCLLRSLGASAEMVMGAQKIPFKAHAWTEVNGRAINERRDVQKIYSIWERC
jgi:Transglutaminase-like superfamily